MKNKYKVIGVITARMSSRRLPGKVMKPLCGKSVFAHHLERLRSISELDGVYLVTSLELENMPLIAEAKRLDVPYYEGEKEDVLERHEKIVRISAASAIIRITCDMPLFDIPTVSAYIEAYNEYQPDYIYPANFNLLNGTMCELVSAGAIIKAHKFYKGPAITKYIIEHPGEFKMKGVAVRNDICRTDVRLDLDFPEDYELINKIYEKLYRGKPIALEDAYGFLDDNPSLILINKFRAHNEAASYVQRLLYKPVFQVIKSGEQYEIINELGQQVNYSDFTDKLKSLFAKQEGD